MKNSQEIPKVYREAIANGTIEYASSDKTSPGRSSCTRFLNALNGLESAGVNIPVGVAFDPDFIIGQIEKRGISVPSIPLFNVKGEASTETRSFTDSFKGKDWTGILKETGSTIRKMTDKEMDESYRRSVAMLKEHKAKKAEAEAERMHDRGFFVDKAGQVHPLFK
jgi:hypothetical protein